MYISNEDWSLGQFEGQPYWEDIPHSIIHVGVRGNTPHNGAF